MSRIAVALGFALLAVAGCTLNRTDLRQDNLLTRIGGGGQIIEPKRCNLKIAIVSRPLRDDALNSALWSVADEQSLPTELRQVLEVNGLRIGLITGELPPAVESVLNAPPPHKVEPMEIMLPDGDHTMVSVGEAVPQVSLLLNREGRAFGKDYQDASGWFHVTSTQKGATGVDLRLVPEIHHGPIQRAFTALPNAGAYTPRQFMQKDGQQEDMLRELGVTLNVQPGQVAVLGCRPDASRSLGSFLFTQPEANSDRLLQKVVLIWASQTSLGQSVNGSTVPAGLEPIEPPKQ